MEINGNLVPPGSYLRQVVLSCLEFIAEGHPFTVVLVEDEIGTQEAADMLKVSRSPYLVKLRDTQALSTRKVGMQRRVWTVRVGPRTPYTHTKAVSPMQACAVHRCHRSPRRCCVA